MESNPFAVLSLIVAPAILTNATSLLVMSTSNRLARAVDRARELSKQLEGTTESLLEGDEAQRRLRELDASEKRTLLLLNSLRSFYVALGAFASSAIVSLLGAVFAPVEVAWFVMLMEVAGVIAGLVAVAAMVRGSALLLTETRIAVRVITERANEIRLRVTRKSSLDNVGDNEL